MRLRLLFLPLLIACASCNGGGGVRLRTVQAVIDGDTIELDGGERVRLLGIDSPERTTPGEECWGDDAFNFLNGRINGHQVRLEYDIVRLDPFDRTLAYIYDGDEFVNGVLLSEGQACLLIIPPNGEEKGPYLQALENSAKAASRGLWAACGGCDTPLVAAP